MTETLSMGQRRAGHVVIEQLVQNHRDGPSRSRIGRLLGRSPLSAADRAGYHDALAQITIGKALEKLPPEWAVISAIPAAGGAPGIDHVVVGPAGVFTIHSRLHPGAMVWVADTIFVVDGYTKSTITDAERHAARVSAVLQSRRPMPVRPVVAVLDAKRITIRERPAQVVVLDAIDLTAELANAPVVLSASEAREIEAILDDPSVWGVSDIVRPAPVSGGIRAADDALWAEFEELDAEVRASASRRAGWKLAGYTVAVVAPIIAFPYLADLVGVLTGR